MVGSSPKPTVACRICSNPTPMLGTKLCDRCWELEKRIHADPELAQRILEGLKKRDNSGSPEAGGR